MARAPHLCTLCTFRCDCGETLADECYGCSICHETNGCDCGEADLGYTGEPEDELAELSANYYMVAR